MCSTLWSHIGVRDPRSAFAEVSNDYDVVIR